jgi:magnesium chelatase family protein
VFSIIKSISLDGLKGYIVNIQVDVSNGLPCFEIVGLPDVSIRESKERVRTAIRNSGYEVLSRKTIINLAPATIKKEGPFFDLPIAIGYLASTKQINKEQLDKIAFVGEISLDGKLNRMNGILPVCLEARRLGIETIIIPNENIKEASIIDGIKIYGANSLKDVVNFLNYGEQLNELHTKWEELKEESKYKIDFSEVKGQHFAKRAIEIAAAGGHNIILIGNPGCGKTMLAQRIPTILPELSFEESLETTKIHSIAGKLNEAEQIVFNRPFREPFHNITKTALIGGGTHPTPGEISLAHHGILYLDEITQFNKELLEFLRIPLEDHRVTISRVNTQVTYPCNFMLVASMNPCPCGYHGSKIKECNCDEKSIKKYLSKISGPLLDRIDIQVRIPESDYKLINTQEETSFEIKKRVERARQIQLERYKEEGIFNNASLTPKLIKKYCMLDANSKRLLDTAFERLGLSLRGYNKILKVARTIADLEGEKSIQSKHIAEAIQYRNLDRI